ncbi:MAG: hypothetical protein ACJ79A_04205 [Gemmatimonadaceae bacterium]
MRHRLVAALLAPSMLGAQEVVLREPGPERVASIVRSAASGPHALRAGSGNLVLPRDSVVTTNLLVLGRPTYVSSRVHGDVVVVGGDLFLRTGSEITGRAIAIGGGVYRTFLGTVGGPIESYRNDHYSVAASPARYELTYQGRGEDRPPIVQPAGLSGLLLPTYDRVDGVSLPVGALVTLGDRAAEIQPSVTYRSRLGVVDPGVSIHIAPERSLRVEAEVGRSTRTNEGWIYSDLINSAVSLAFGDDTRNYFRADGGTARAIVHVERTGITFEPFVGGRFEKVSPISATGTVYSFSGRSSIERMARPNPLVERGEIGSGLVGATLEYKVGPVQAKLNAEGEQSFRTPDSTSSFTQLTLNGTIEFPTFGSQRLRIDAHGVATAGDSTPRARYAYLGRGGTLPLLELLEQGGDQVVFVESRYQIPVAIVVLPKLGSPTLHLRHLMGAAGVASLPKLEQELGVGVGISVVKFEATFDAAGERDTRYGLSVVMGR